MKVYTRKGDEGQTGLLGGTRVPKHHPRIEAYGTLDELNAWIGKVASHDASVSMQVKLQQIQNELFTLGSHLATTDLQWKAKLPKMNPQGPDELESWMDEMEVSLPELTSFVLPGGHPAACDAHVARTVCRRAERRCVALHRVEPIEELGLAYLNRLSDALFILGRWLAHDTGTSEIPWAPSQD